MTDRTGTIPSAIRVATENTIDVSLLQSINYSYEDCCIIQATRISEMIRLENKKVYLLYSGGIDSSVVVSAMLAVVPTHLLSSVTILMTPDSVVENPEFYEKIIRNKVRREISTYAIDLLESEDNVLVSGELNDQLSGAPLPIRRLNWTYGNVYNKTNYKEIVFKFFLDQFNNSSQDAYSLVDYLEPLMLKCPGGVQTVNGYMWWLGFCMKWDSVYWRMLSFKVPRYGQNAIIFPPYVRNNYINFFSTVNHQAWAVKQEVTRYPDDDGSTNKEESKRLVKKLTGIDLSKKTKVGSLGNLIMGLRRTNFLDTDLRADIEVNLSEYINA